MAAPKLSVILKSALSRGTSKPFDKLLEEICSDFGLRKAFIRLTINNRDRFDWPKEAGVYVIRKSGNSDALYIGAVGRIADKGTFVTSSTLAQRGHRWTPYYFDKDNKVFCYSPKDGKAKGRSGHLQNGYLKKVKFYRLEILCFAVTDADRVAPVAIEALLLQMHLEQFGHLPQASRQF
jgi:hypothetical protein